MVRRFVVIGALAVLITSACSSGSKPSTSGSASAGKAAGTSTVDVTLSDDGCEPRLISAGAGPTTFKVTNDGSAAVTEFEVLQGGHILGEVENVTPGADRSFSLTLKEGKYDTKCPGGAKFEAGSIEVAAAGSGDVADQAARDAAVTTYLTYVKGRADELIAKTTPFVAAVKAGDAAKAKQLFAGARAPYEAIEPIAESFGDLDPAIDARQGDVADAEWGGFHRIEKALWADNSLAGMDAVADKLTADETKLRQSIDTVKLEPAQIANGAVELLNEVSTSKITGEEDRYSHTDLSDFAENLAGSKAAFDAVRSLLQAKEAALVTDITQRFAAVEQALDAHKGTDAEGNGYVLYTTLTPTDTRALSAVVDALAEPLSKVAAIVIA